MAKFVTGARNGVSGKIHSYDVRAAQRGAQKERRGLAKAEASMKGSEGKWDRTIIHGPGGPLRR